MASGPLLSRLRWPEKTLHAAGRQEIQEAKDNEERMWEAHQDAVAQWKTFPSG